VLGKAAKTMGKLADKSVDRISFSKYGTYFGDIGKQGTKFKVKALNISDSKHFLLFLVGLI
jgi:hypothetical protein